MKHRSFEALLRRGLSAGVALIIVVIPFHAFLTVWLNSAVGHYTLLRLWKEILLVPLGLSAVWFTAHHPGLRRQVGHSWLWRLIWLYVAILLLWGVIAWHQGAVTAKALLYGELVDLRLFAMLFISLVAATIAPWLVNHWRRLLLWPALAVVTIGLLQRFVLPYDVLKHFGYNRATIPPYETIDHKTSYPRIRSTLRGANLLGGYLLVVLSERLLRLRMYGRRWLTGLALLAGLIVLFASGSRGAWLGLVVAVVVLVGLQLSSRRARQLALLALIGVLLAGGGGIVALRHNDFVENTVFHTDEHSRSATSSNAAHLSASRQAAVEVIHEPLGRGPGTAGPAGVYNTGHPARIAEDYFLQIGQETGWLGLLVFVAILALTVRQLWQRRHTELAALLLAALAGLSVMALLMHIWADDTIAYLFWGLCGIALALPTEGGRGDAAID